MNEPLWHGTAHAARFPALQEDIEADVAIVGAGITGVTTAMLLADSGLEVVVLEAGGVGLGTTGHSTGNLYATVDRRLHTIEDRWDRETMRAVAHSRAEAIDLIEQTVRRYGLDCDFARRPFCLFASESSRAAIEAIEREHRAAIHADLNARLVDAIPLPYPVVRALVIENQAQFHPLNYVRSLARHVADDGCRICENTRVTAIDDERGLIHTETATVQAHRIVLATHTPKGTYAVQTAMEVYREYGVAARLRGDACSEGIYWNTSTRHSIRGYRDGDARYVIVIGGHHKVGREEHTEQCYEALEQHVRERFDVERFVYRWSAQNYRAADGLPYIGRSNGADRTYIATGFGADGLVYGTLAAVVIAEDLQARESRWSDLYDASRFTPIKSAKGFMRESVGVAKDFARGWLKRYPKAFEEVRAGEGQVLQIEGEHLAVFRDFDQRYVAVSPVCTHMGCIVHWNNAEKTWDCPCHGSRFSVEGAIIEGPALAPLARHALDEPADTGAGADEEAPRPPAPH